ncbi:MAG: serine/threonine protein kinase [Deltaproteobacteria bacterium]|nr:serine/threonine protein kinase [Deltaproteobacteria bacterium]
MSSDPAPREKIDASAWVGRVIDERYRVLELLGEGAMGAVFAAEHLGLRKQVALKVVLPRHAGDAELAARFAREAMLTARLEHPHVASAIDCGSLPEGGSYLVARLARGQSLRAWMAERRGWRHALVIGLQMADALAAAHEQEIVHRDLKPDNVVVDERGDGVPHVWVLDFGIAREGASAGALTRVGTIMGTPGYMAPEQAVGQPVDARADVYALGVILWEVSTGRTLFESRELGKLVEAQLLSTAPRISTHVPDVPRALDALVAQMLESSKGKRPASCVVVRDALRAIDGARVSASLAPTAIAAAAPTPSHPAGRSSAALAEASASPTLREDAPTAVARSSIRGVADRPPLWMIGLAVSGLIAVLALLVPVSCVVSRTCAGDGSPPIAVPVLPRPAEASAEPAPYLAALRDYETATDCDARKRAIKRVRQLGDPRALPELARIAADPRAGCTSGGRDGCNLCREIEKAIERLSRGRDDDREDEPD